MVLEKLSKTGEGAEETDGRPSQGTVERHTAGQGSGPVADRPLTGVVAALKGQ